MLHLVAVVVASALVGASPRAVAAGGPAGDRVADLKGEWNCRTEYGYPGRLTVGAVGDALVVADETRYPSTTRTRHERYRRDAASGDWRAESDDDYGFEGRGPAWTGDAWRLDGVMRSRSTGTSVDAHLLYERRDDGMLRVSRWTSNPSAARYVELCRRGGVPPDPSTCVVPNLPAIALTAGEPDVPWLGSESGSVQVAVSLDADSKIVSTAIASSPSVSLSAAALSVARRSTFHTAQRDCRKVPSQYLFTVDFNVR
jgi:hypothetical protein